MNWIILSKIAVFWPQNYLFLTLEPRIVKISIKNQCKLDPIRKNLLLKNHDFVIVIEILGIKVDNLMQLDSIVLKHCCRGILA